MRKILSQKAIQAILGIKEDVDITTDRMAKKLLITYYPVGNTKISENVKEFSIELREAFDKLGVTIIPYSESMYLLPRKRVVRRAFKIFIGNIIALFNKARNIESLYIPWKDARAMLRRKRIKKGVSIVVLGENDIGNLPMERINSFKENSVITLVDFPSHITEDSSFDEHFRASMSLFAHHMTNIAICVNDKNWMLYNFNASHPVFSRGEGIERGVIDALVPKLVAPIRPYKISEFLVTKDAFEISDKRHEESSEDLISASSKFASTNLFPDGRNIDDLPFRSNFHRLIGKMHLDNRNGMSFGFLAKQLPTHLSLVHKENSLPDKLSNLEFGDSDYIQNKNGIYVKFQIVDDGEHYVMKIPDISVLSQRSGSDKTNIDPENDILKLGLVNGRMLLDTPQGFGKKITSRPSFDTQVILAHAVGNAMVASISRFFDSASELANNIEEFGMGICHWHGYMHSNHIPVHHSVYGRNNPHVSCSSPQSAIYALDGKLSNFIEMHNTGKTYVGDIHVEPHHGSNINFTNLIDLAKIFIENPSATELGNKYL